jgi:hypothetical protein
VRLPTIYDFDKQDDKAELFIQHAKLSIILGGIVDRHAQKSEMTQNEV